MSEEDAPPAEPASAGGAGDRLRRERERQELSLENISSTTRIPLRHLEAIEAGDFANLPARTYAVGFTRTYAKALGMDERAITDQVRAELGAEDPGERYASGHALQPGDPARVPSRGLVFFSIAAILLLLAGAFMFYRTFFAPAAGPGSILAEEERVQAEATLAEDAASDTDEDAVDPSGEVVFTALEDDIWIKFYDGAGNQLMQKQMAKGERYTVPADAADPQAWTGRPYAFAITIGGKPVPKLSEAEETVKDVPVSAEALLARAQAPAAGPTPQPAAQPAPQT